MAVHVGDIGTALILTVRDQDGKIVDLSQVSALSMVLLKPDLTTLMKTAVLVTDGKDGQMQYVTIANDLDQPGVWRRQGIVTIGAGKWESDTVSFSVEANLT